MFDIQVFTGIPVTENITFLITETTVNMWIVMVLLLLFAIIVRIKSRNWNPTDKPTGLQNFAEMCIDAWEKLFKGSSSEKLMYLSPWFFTLFAFLLISNMIGVTGLRPPTADWGLTFPLAFSSFILFQYAGIRHRPKAYLKGIFFDPHPLMAPFFAPLNVIGELARPISLSFRLFGNILGGMVLLSLLYGLAPMVLRFLLPVPLHLYFDIAVGALQAFIFTMLSITFAGIAAED